VFLTTQTSININTDPQWWTSVCTISTWQCPYKVLPLTASELLLVVLIAHHINR